LEKFLGKNGFQVVRPELLSAQEQIEVFRSANLVVAESGAAMTNLMFMRPNTTVIEIHPIDDATGFWSEFGNIFNVNVFVSKGKRGIFTRLFSQSDSYRVDMPSFKKMVRNFPKS
jgi:hypothetical protein